MSVVERMAGGIEAVPGVLNDAGVVYRFEALRGRLLFVRPGSEDQYAEFYSLTCREYEEYLATLMRHARYLAELRCAQA
jgi:hypothetical protein